MNKEDIINPLELDALCEQLQQENKQLKEKIDKYENPNDMTLYTMWCTEIVKDENKQLKDNWNKLKKWIGNKDNNGFEKLYLEDIQIKMQELESGDSDE